MYLVRRGLTHHVTRWVGPRLTSMYLEDVMSRVPRSPHSLQALLLSHTSSLDVPKLLFALLQLLLSAGVSGRPFDIPFVVLVVRFHVDRVTLPLVVAFW